MTTVFHAWLYGKFIEIQSNLMRKKLHKMNQGSNFLGSIFSNRDNIRAPIQFQEKVNPSILKNDFSSRTDPSIFTSVAPVLFDWLYKTKFTEIYKPFPALVQSLRSDSSSEANSNYCHRSDASSHLEE